MTIPYADGLSRFGRLCFALALVAFGVAHFIVGDFVAGRAPAYPAGMPGGTAWAFLSGAAFLVAGMAVFAHRQAVRALFVVSLLIVVWAVLRQIPLAAADHMLGGAWTMLGKGVALAGGALGVAASILWASPEGSDSAARDRRAATLGLVGRCSLGAFLVLAGIQHFLFPQFVMTLVPAWIPGPLFWTYFAGVSLIAGGVGLALPPTARLAAVFVGGMIFTWLLVLHIPRALAASGPGAATNEWTAVIEALAFSAVAFALVARPRRVMRS